MSASGADDVDLFEPGPGVTACLLVPLPVLHALVDVPDSNADQRRAKGWVSDQLRAIGVNASRDEQVQR